MYLVDNDVSLVITDSNGNSRTLITMTACVDLTKWNFVSLDYLYRDDGQGYKEIAEYALTVNSKTQLYNFNNSDIVYVYLGDATKLSIGYDNVDNDKVFCAKATAVYFSRTYLTLEKVKKYYRLSKDYLIENELVDDNIEGVDFGATTLYTTDSTIQNMFEIYPLQNSVTSLSGKKPIAFSKRILSEADKDSTFNFNKDVRRYAYVADGEELVYDIGDVTDVTIAMRAYTDVDEKEQYFFECIDEKGRTFGLYRSASKLLWLNINGRSYGTGLTFSSDEWHNIAVSKSRRLSSNSLSTYYEDSLRVIVDGESYSTTTVMCPDYGNMKMMVGRRYNTTGSAYNLGEEKVCYPLYGQIEMLSTASAFCEESTITKLLNESKCTTKVNYYDDFGMHNFMEIHNGDERILLKATGYKKRSTKKYISNQVYTEIWIGKDSSSATLRAYATDQSGRVTAILDTNFGGHSYVYDSRGYLINEDGVSYTYDKNGNVTNIGDTVLTYDSTIKDRLMSYNGYDITYDSRNPFNISSYKGNSYTFEGRRLTKITTSSGYWEYTYNDLGLRTQKRDHRGVTTYYEYDGDKLVYEQNSTARLDFLYDENGELYGFIKNSTDKYYYLRDYLKNILGIIDSSGKLVVKYNYGAYGKCTISSDTSGCNIGSLNPFRYKGYYYDSETGMYYCQSRYYVPDWCRWLNADNPNFLEPQSLNSLNLFAYCGNDPVNGKQSFIFSGDSVISSSISVGGKLSDTGNFSAPWWALTTVGAIPDLVLGFRYLSASGMHSKFAYATNKRYMYPILGGTWRWFDKSSSSFKTVTQGTFKQILTGDARARFGSIAKSVGGVVGLNLLINFGFNLYENNWQVDSAMLVDTAIDTAIGVGSYCLAAGVMSLVATGLLTASVSLPGILVVGGVIVLSIGFEHLIREITGYRD